MTPEESRFLLQARWPRVEAVVRQYGGDPVTDLWRSDLILRVRMLSRQSAGGQTVRDLYIFRLDQADYDEHAPRVCLCNPEKPDEIGSGKQFYPKIEGNNVFNHDGFLCMPGDRRCYEAGNHSEWRKKEHFHPDVVIGYLFALVTSSQYRGRL